MTMEWKKELFVKEISF